MNKIPEGVENLLHSVRAWNHWKEPYIEAEGDVVAVTMANGVFVAFQSEDDLFLVQAVTLKGHKTRIMHVAKDDYDKMDLLLKTCHSA